MRAVLVGAGGFRLVELDRPSPGPGEVLVKMLACGLCGTDVEKIEGRYEGSKPVIGHEAAGVVVEYGEGVEGLRAGDLVVPHHHTNCGECYYCRSGSPTMCPSYREYNFTPGGFSEYFVVPRFIVERGGVHKVPAGLDPLRACLTEPTACALRALKRVSGDADHSFAVIGLGPVGLTFVQLLYLRGAEPLIGLDINDARISAAERYGAVGLNAGVGDVLERVRHLTGGRGVDVSIVAAGSPTALQLGIRLARRGGKVCLFGIPPKDSQLRHDLSDLIIREISIVTSNAASEVEMSEALRLISENLIDTKKLITGTYRIEEFGEAVKGFKEGRGIKTIITP